MTAPIYRSVDHLSGEHRPSKLSVDLPEAGGDVCQGCAELEQLRDENAELRCRVDELTEENKTLTSERDTLLNAVADAHAKLDNQPSWGGPW